MSAGDHSIGGRHPQQGAPKGETVPFADVDEVRPVPATVLQEPAEISSYAYAESPAYGLPPVDFGNTEGAAAPAALGAGAMAASVLSTEAPAEHCPPAPTSSTKTPQLGHMPDPSRSAPARTSPALIIGSAIGGIGVLVGVLGMFLYWQSQTTSVPGATTVRTPVVVATPPATVTAPPVALPPPPIVATPDPGTPAPTPPRPRPPTKKTAPTTAVPSANPSATRGSLPGESPGGFWIPGFPELDLPPVGGTGARRHTTDLPGAHRF